MSACVDDRTEAANANAAVADAAQVLRFRCSERHLHWAIAVPFMVCYTTAAILVFVYNPQPDRPLHALVSWIHRISGGCLIVLPPAMLMRHWRDGWLHAHNIRRAWRWTLADLRWLLLTGPATMGAKVTLPHQGKFNAGEKINFIAVMSTYPVYVVTGVLIALPGIAYTSWLVHVYTAALVATPLMLGHMFMALVNPDTRVGLSGMISGFVDRHWAHHHYRLWYDELYGEIAVPADVADEMDEMHAPGLRDLTGIGATAVAKESAAERQQPSIDGGITADVALAGGGLQ